MTRGNKLDSAVAIASGQVLASVRILGISVLAVLLACTQLNSFAADKLITAVPTGWRLQDYVGSVVTIWFTPSTCSNGNLSLPSGATVAEINRLWALVLAAKLGSHAVYVYYDDTISPGSCFITSFGMEG